MRLGILGSLIVWAGVSAVSGQEVVREFSWTALKKAGQLGVGEIEPGGPAGQHEQLKIDNPTDEPKTVTLLDLKNPGVTAFQYAIEGSVRYEKVKGKSYLEMWNWFADGGRYFTRTLGDSRPLQSLEGSSDWRSFTLPFFSNANGGLPKRIVVNVVFAGRGTVYLSPVRLLQYGDANQLQDRLGAPVNLPQGGLGWWSDLSWPWFIVVEGILGGLGGGLVGILGSIGRARRFVLTLVALSAAVGAVNFVVGVIALILRQPFAVCHPLLTAGSVLLIVPCATYPSLRRRYEQIELRKMAAMDSR